MLDTEEIPYTFDLFGHIDVDEFHLAHLVASFKRVAVNFCSVRTFTFLTTRGYQSQCMREVKEIIAFICDRAVGVRLLPGANIFLLITPVKWAGIA